MLAGVALSPAMMAAGSPGARWSSKKTQTATTPITGTTESRRRTMVKLMARLATLSGLGQVPERDHLRHRQPALDVLAMRHRLLPLPKVEMRHDIPGMLLDLDRDVLAVGVALGLNPLGPKLLVQLV